MRRTISAAHFAAAHVGRLNNGSFGAVPQQVIKAQISLEKNKLQQPEHYILTSQMPGFAFAESTATSGSI